MKALQQQNNWLKQQLDIQKDRDDLLRDIRNPVSEVEGGSSQDAPALRQQGVCGSICSLLGRR